MSEKYFVIFRTLNFDEKTKEKVKKKKKGKEFLTYLRNLENYMKI